MEGDSQSVATSAGMVLTQEQLNKKLAKTRDQLKKTIDRIVVMESEELKSLERIKSLELVVSELTAQNISHSQMLTEHTDVCTRLENRLLQLEEVKPDYNSDDSADSVENHWEREPPAIKPEDLKKSLSGKSQPPERTNIHRTVPVLQTQGQGPRTDAHYGLTTTANPASILATNLEPDEEALSEGRLSDGVRHSDEFRHGIRAKVLDTARVVHYRFEGKEKDYLQ